MTPQSVCLTLIALLALPSVVSANWELTRAILDDTDTKIALVRDAEGTTLRIHRDADNEMQGTLSFSKGFSAALPDTCVTLQVDQFDPTVLNTADGNCVTNEHGQFLFSFGQVDSNQVKHGSLSQMMFGMSLSLRYQLKNTGYHEASFSLRGSSYAINSVVALPAETPEP